MKKVKKMMTGLMAGAALLALTAAPAAAQSEVSGNYAIQKWNSTWGDAAKGFSVDFSQPFHKNDSMAISAVGDFGWTRFSGEETDTSFVGGVRFKFLRNKPVSLFVQGTTGVVHWSEDAAGTFAAASGNDFIIGAGGGVQIRVNDKFDVKPFQFDWWVLPNDNNDKIYRMTFGGVFKFGKQ